MKTISSLLLSLLLTTTTAQSRPRYNVYSLPPFEIKLSIDLWTTVLNGSYLNVRQLQDGGTKDYSTSDPSYALSNLKASLLQAPFHKSDSTSNHLPSYILQLLTEYTNSYLSTFLHSAFNDNVREERGWSLVHAIDLRGEWVDVTFWKSEVNYVEGETRRSRLDSRLSGGRGMEEEEETFASLTVAFSGTAAVLQGKNATDVITEGEDALLNSPQIDRSLLRMGMNKAFLPPDGPYQFLSHVITSSMEDRLYSLSAVENTKESTMEHDAALVLSGGRDVQTRMDLDLFPTADFVASTTVYVASGERRESLTVFLLGAYLVLFIGGFYIYASHRYRKNHLRYQLERYGNKDVVLFKHKYKRARTQRLVNFVSGWGGSNRRDNVSPLTVEIDGVDGYFERELSGVDSSEEDIYDLEAEDGGKHEYCEEKQDLEKGLRESYNESTRFKKGLDMNPIDQESVSSKNVGTIKPVDDDTAPTKVDWNQVLENVVPIPASDAVSNLDDHNSTYHVSSNSGDILVQRRYVQPASPFDVLYGAAFLHGEADRVKAQRRMDKPKKKKIRASPSGRRRKKKKKTITMTLVSEAMNGSRSKDAIKPMMTIAEVEGGIQEVFNEDLNEEEDDCSEGEDVVQDLAQFTPGELRHNPSPMSFYSPGNFMRNLSDKYNLGLFDASVENGGGFEQVKDGQGGSISGAVGGDEFPVEEGVVFKDFPRQDGTPCIIYNPKGNEVEGGTETESSCDASPVEDDIVYSEQRAAANDEVNSSVDNEANITIDLDANTTIDLDGNDEEQVQPKDDFAIKMNLLLDSKRRQIEERKAMELEMQARRREREERKRLAAEAELTSSNEDGKEAKDEEGSMVTNKLV